MSCGDASDGCDKDEELGNGATTGDQDGLQPVATGGGLTDTNVAAITAGYAHTCAVTTAGKAYCWGSDSVGQIGNDVVGAENSPMALTWRYVSDRNRCLPLT
jgi:alpha-tubulin suppressor-like RCC1 family protein